MIGTMVRGLAVLLIGFVLCLSGRVDGSVAADAGKDYETALKLFASGKFHEIVARYQRYSWDARNSPDILQLYCASLARVGKSVLPDAFVTPAVPTYVTEYATGYLNLLSGKAGRAGAIFYKLQEREDRISRLWGNLGNLEISVVTGNIAAMEEPLEKIRELRKTADLAGPALRDINFYEIYHKLSTAQFAVADRLLAERKNELHRARYAELKLTLLLRDDLFREAKMLFQELPDPEKSLDSIAVLWGRLLRNMSGESAYRAYLLERSRDPSHNAAARTELAATNLFSSNADQKAAGVEELYKLRDQHPNDANLQLYIANYLLEYKGSKDPLGGVRKLPEVPVNFVMYHVVMAKALLPRNVKAAMDSFNRAKAMDSYNPEVLHLEYSTAMSQGDLRTAKSALLRALRVEPNAPDILLSLAEIHYDEKNAIGLVGIRDRIRALKRVISPDIAKQIDSMIVGLCASFGAQELPYGCK